MDEPKFKVGDMVFAHDTGDRVFRITVVNYSHRVSRIVYILEGRDNFYLESELTKAPS